MHRFRQPILTPTVRAINAPVTATGPSAKSRPLCPSSLPYPQLQNEQYYVYKFQNAQGRGASVNMAHPAEIQRGRSRTPHRPESKLFIIVDNAATNYILCPYKTIGMYQKCVDVERINPRRALFTRFSIMLGWLTLINRFVKCSPSMCIIFVWGRH